MDGMESIKETFYLECEELLAELESGLILLNDGNGDDDTVAAVFRAVHSIKGGAGAFGLNDLVDFAHKFENTLDDVREDRLEATPEVLSVLLQSSDMLNDLVVAARDYIEHDTARAKELITELKALSVSDADGAAEAFENFYFEPVTLDFDMDTASDGPTVDTYTITFKPHSALCENGSSVTRLLRNLSDLGEMSAICETKELPDFLALDPDESYLSWTITLLTESPESEIDNVFEFVIDYCDLEVALEDGDNAPAFDLSMFEAAPLNPSNDQGGNEVLIPSTFEAEEFPAAALPKLAHESSPEAPAAPVTPPKAEGPAAKKPATQRAAPPATIRINLERVDRLINLVGELVINQAMLTECVMDGGLGRNPAAVSGLDEFKQLTRDIQESVMAIRAQPVQPLFQRMSRIVRESAQSTKKSAKLVLEGEFTEVDKTIVEKLADPLTHMIRNAIDHGLETPEKRVEKGKSEMGTVKLSAAHRSGKIVIEVSDDGAGINRPRVKKIAIDKGLIVEDAKLSDSEIDNLLFMPGFSTAEAVSTLSGRGVGMDVVKRAIQSIGGRITISSKPDLGSKFTINLPLTLAVLDGMLIEIAGQTLVVPLSAIVETLSPDADDIHRVGPGNQVINVRGNFIPLIDLGQALRFRTTSADITKSVVLTVETEDGSQNAILVDGIQDQRQVVIKSLEDNYGHVPSVAAATILGNGRIALILDVDDVVSRSSIRGAVTIASVQTPEQAYA